MRSSRRDFLKTAALASAPFLFSGCASPAVVKVKGPNEKINMGFIGFGIQARGLLGAFLPQDVQVLAICDVDTTRRTDGVKRVDDFYKANPEKGKVGVCKGYSDFREVLAREDIDAVCIATPDHWHAIITITAMKAGKDVYCEKPLTYNIREAVAVMATAKQTRRILQTGAMQRSGYEFRTACELVRNGCIGTVERAECFFGGPPHAHNLSKEEMEPGLDWDLWCGPAPLVDYNSKLSPRGVHDFFPMEWRFDELFGGGYTTDWGAHHLDIAQWGLGMDETSPVKVICPPEDPKQKFGVQLVYANGIPIIHKDWSDFGTSFFGSEGEVHVNRGKFAMYMGKGDGKKQIAKFTKQEDGLSLEAHCQKARKEFLKDPKVNLYKSSSHPADFINCIRSRQKACSNEDVGGHSAILCHLINIAYLKAADPKKGWSFDWDPKRQRFAGKSGDPKWTSRVYRGAWTI